MRKIDIQDGRQGGHSGFPIRMILAIFDLQVTPMLPDKIDSGEEEKNRFSRWPPWWPSWISNLNDFSCFDLQVTLMLHTKLQVSWPFSSGEHGGHLAFPFGMILAIFDLQVMLTTEFQVNWPFGSGEEAKNRFLKWLPWWPSWISNRNDYSYF